MKSRAIHEHCYSKAPVSTLPGRGPTLGVVRQLLSGNAPIPIDDWDELTSDLQREGVLPYLAFEWMRRAGEIPAPVHKELKHALLMGEAEKLSDDSELELIFTAAKKAKLPVLVIKGEALARSLYPAASCRPTGDYDLLIQPHDLAGFQTLLGKLGYQGGNFAGQHIFAQQNWVCQADVRGRSFQVDLHGTSPISVFSAGACPCRRCGQMRKAICPAPAKSPLPRTRMRC